MMRRLSVFLVTVLFLGGVAFAGGEGDACKGCTPAAAPTGPVGEKGEKGAPAPVVRDKQETHEVTVTEEGRPGEIDQVLRILLGGDWNSLPPDAKKQILSSLRTQLDPAALEKALELLVKGEKSIEVKVHGPFHVGPPKMMKTMEDGACPKMKDGTCPKMKDGACPKCGVRISGKKARRDADDDDADEAREGAHRAPAFFFFGDRDDEGRELPEGVRERIREMIRGALERRGPRPDAPFARPRGPMAGPDRPMARGMRPGAPGPDYRPHLGRGFPGVGRPDDYGPQMLDALRDIQNELRMMRRDMARMHAGMRGGPTDRPGPHAAPAPASPQHMGGIQIFREGAKPGASAPGSATPVMPRTRELRVIGPDGKPLEGMVRIAAPPPDVAALKAQVEELKAKLAQTTAQMKKLAARLEKLETEK